MKFFFDGHKSFTCVELLSTPIFEGKLKIMKLKKKNKNTNLSIILVTMNDLLYIDITQNMQLINDIKLKNINKELKI